MTEEKKSILDSNLSTEEIEEIKREKTEEQEQYIQEQYDKGVIPKYENGNGDSFYCFIFVKLFDYF